MLVHCSIYHCRCMTEQQVSQDVPTKPSTARSEQNKNKWLLLLCHLEKVDASRLPPLRVVFQQESKQLSTLNRSPIGMGPCCVVLRSFYCLGDRIDVLLSIAYLVTLKFFLKKWHWQHFSPVRNSALKK